MLFTFVARAMSYEEARDQAWFLTDKMAYELNLTSEQYDRAYQINLDYLMSVRTPSDCIGAYWQYRDSDFRCILYDWQYNLYRTLDYFFRPVRWYESRWYYPVFDHYRFGYYYFDRPGVYVSYRGGMWRRRGHNTPSPYLTMRPHQGGVGMRDQYRRGWVGPGAPRPNDGFNPGGGYRPGGNNRGFRPNGDNRPGMGRPEGGRPNNRPNVGRPNNGGRPDRPNNNGGMNGRPNNNSGNRPSFNGGTRGHGSSNSTPGGFRDGYTNYRQTGNSGTPSAPRGGFTPTMRSNSNAGGSTSRSGRVFGGR